MPKVLQPVKRIDAGDMSGNLTSMVVDGRYYANVKFQLQWTGTPTGAFVLEESLDWDPVKQTGNWFDNGAGITGPSGVAGSALVNMSNRAPCFYRLRYTAGGGSGALTVWASGSGP